VALNEIEKNSFDLCVIGGGATGAGCALDAQLRGLRTVLVEAGDFACATSSSSTKLIHGGVRYLEQAISERELGQYHVASMAPRKELLPGNIAIIISKATNDILVIRTCARALRWRLEHDFFMA
jgi:glycerol-3-phosphate dehydrogenase